MRRKRWTLRPDTRPAGLDIELTMEDVLADLAPGWWGTPPTNPEQGCEGIRDDTHRRVAGPSGAPGATRGRLAASRAALWATWLGVQVLGRLGLGGALAWHLWFTPWADHDRRVRAHDDAWLAGATRLRIRVGDRDLAAWSAGRGPTVLLVHGWADRAARLGALVEPLTAAGFRVVGVDLPGHGDSADGPKDLYALAATVQAVAGQVEARAVVAHSLGALATVLALREGSPLQAVALIAPAVRLEHALERFVTIFRLPPRAVADLRARLERRFGTDVWRDVAADAIARSLDLPALIVHDVADAQVAFADAQLLADAWQGASLHATQGLGHRRVVTDPAVTRVVADTLAGALGSAEPSADDRADVPLSS